MTWSCEPWCRQASWRPKNQSAFHDEMANAQTEWRKYRGARENCWSGTSQLWALLHSLCLCRSSWTRRRGWTACCQEVRKVRPTLHGIHVPPNPRGDPGPDEWVCVPFLWRPWHKNLWRHWWHSRSFFHFPSALSYHSTLQCGSLTQDIHSARRFGPLAISHFVFNAFVCF